MRLEKDKLNVDEHDASTIDENNNNNSDDDNNASEAQATAAAAASETEQGQGDKEGEDRAGVREAQDDAGQAALLLPAAPSTRRMRDGKL